MRISEYVLVGVVPLQDCHRRIIDYLRISVTDRCNFRCTYCMPETGISRLPAREILSYEEIVKLVGVFVSCGVRKVRITGGEPLVRKGIINFIKQVRKWQGIQDLSMTTNGSLLAEKAQQLKDAGLDRVNISMDTADSEKFAGITRRGKLDATLRGIESALKVGLVPVKINVVLTGIFSQEDLLYFIQNTYKYPISVRFIEQMPIGNTEEHQGMSISDVKNFLSMAGYGALMSVSSASGNGPAKYYVLPNAPGNFGFITPVSAHFCSSCNRMRMTADGKLRPCLLSNEEIDIKGPLRAGASDEALKELLYQAVASKPDSHQLCRTSGHQEFIRTMSQIGG